MTKKHFIALAEVLKILKKSVGDHLFFEAVLQSITKFCKDSNPNFDEKRFRDYIDGKVRSNGGRVKKSTK